MTEEAIEEFTQRTGLTVFEASAKTGTGVESSFIALTEALVELAVQNQPKKKDKETPDSGTATSIVGSEPVGSNDANPYYYDNEGDQLPFDDNKIKMKRI